MSDLDLTEAVTTADGHTLVAAEAAALVAINRRLGWASLHWGTERVSPDAWPHIAIAAAAGVRGHVAPAPEIERKARHESARLYPWDGSEPDPIIALRSAFRAGAEYAARIARGEVS
jgi:hypothetical protein